MPVTAKDALKMWDAGEPIPAFQVESVGSSQSEIYGAAFDWIRYEELDVHAKEIDGAPDSVKRLPRREQEVAHSIAFVALKNGWAKMVTSHIHQVSPAITVQKPLATSH